LGINGIAGVYYLAMAMVGYGLSNGLQVQMSRRTGEGNRAGLVKVFFNGVLLTLGFSFGLMLFSLWLAPVIFGYSLHSSEHFALSVDFIYLRIWGLPFLLVNQLCNAYFIATGRSKFLIAGSFVGASVNIILDYTLIFGHFGFTQMGLQGAAIASVFSELASCLTVVGILVYKRLKNLMHYIQQMSFDPAMSVRSLQVASPLIVQYLFSIGGWLIFFFFIEHLGQDELAASQILRSILGIAGIGTWALAATANMMVSNVIGQGKENEVKPVIRKIAWTSFVYTFVVCGFIALLSTNFLMLYRPDAEFAKFALPSMYIVLSGTLFMSFSTVIFNGVVGTGNTLVNLAIEVTCVLTYIFYCYWIIELKKSSLAMAWTSEYVYWVSLFIWSGLYLWSNKWKGKKV